MDRWASLGNEVGSRPAVATWAENEMQVFFIGTDGQLWDTYWDGAAWHERHPHGGELVGSAAACSWGPDRIDVFAQGRDGSLLHRWYEPAG
ncbi:MAG: carbohydrate-binding protein, partial [Candidatus Limnocylindria bacterium]